MKKALWILGCIASITLTTQLHAQAYDRDPMKVDKQHVNSWNLFAENSLALHNRQIDGRTIRTTEKTGGYRDDPEFYKEISYYDTATGLLLSRIQWETENQGQFHSLEVFVYDNNGKLLRDYGATYLPGRRNAPVQTLINLHGHNEGLHGIRQFDASGDRIYELCKGVYKGKEIQIRLFEDDLAGASDEADELMASPVYEACFGTISEKLGKYVMPQ